MPFELTREELIEFIVGVFNNAYYGFLVVAGSGHVALANLRACTLLGIPHEKLVGMHYEDFTVEAYIDEDNDKTGKVLSGELPYHTMQKQYYCGPERTPLLHRLTVSRVNYPGGGDFRHFFAVIEPLEGPHARG